MQGRLQAGEFVSYLPKGRDGDIEAMHNTGKRFQPPFVCTCQWKVGGDGANNFHERVYAYFAKLGLQQQQLIKFGLFMFLKM